MCCCCCCIFLALSLCEQHYNLCTLENRCICAWLQHNPAKREWWVPWRREKRDRANDRIESSPHSNLEIVKMEKKWRQKRSVYFFFRMRMEYQKREEVMEMSDLLTINDRFERECVGWACTTYGLCCCIDSHVFRSRLRFSNLIELRRSLRHSFRWLNFIIAITISPHTCPKWFCALGIQLILKCCDLIN